MPMPDVGVTSANNVWYPICTLPGVDELKRYITALTLAAALLAHIAGRAITIAATAIGTNGMRMKTVLTASIFKNIIVLIATLIKRVNEIGMHISTGVTTTATLLKSARSLT